MGVSANTTQYNIGRDCSVVIMDPVASGGRLQLSNVTDFEVTRTGAKIKIDRLDGIRIRDDLPGGGSGSFKIERANSTMTDYLAKRDNIIDAGQPRPARAIMYQYVKEQDGSTTTYEYSEVAFGDADMGTFSGDKTVAQKLPFIYGQMKRL